MAMGVRYWRRLFVEDQGGLRGVVVMLLSRWKGREGKE